MRSLHRISLLLVAALAVGAAACAPQETAPVEDETAKTAELDGFVNAYIEAYDAGDAAALAALWAEDGTLSPPMTATVERAGIEALYAAMFASGGGLTLEVSREDAIFSGDRVASWGGFVVNGQGPDGAPFAAEGRFGNVLRKEADGSWRLVRHMYNWVTPPPGFGAPQG
jgi:uncharacterized protein (TIGR02246 family)